MQRNVSPITTIIVVLLALGIAAFAWMRLSTGPKPITQRDRAEMRNSATSPRKNDASARHRGARGGRGSRRGSRGRGGEEASSRHGPNGRGQERPGPGAAAGTQAKPGGAEESKATATAGTAKAGSGR